MPASDRFESFTVEATANTTAATVELRLHTESGWLSHLAILTDDQAGELAAQLEHARTRLAEHAVRHTNEQARADYFAALVRGGKR